jgi:branched-chain amino acid transport system substrate-binding protein
MKIGILIPRSTIYPTIGFDFLDGLRTSLQYHGLTDAVVVSENIGFGGDRKEVTSAAEKLLMQHEADVVVGYSSDFHSESLNNLFSAAGRIFISLESGYDLPLESKEYSNIFRISLNGYTVARQAIKVAAAEGVKRYMVSCSFYDGGYKMPVAFGSLGDELGGQPTGTFVTPLKTTDFTLQPLIAALEADMPDAVLASFCNEMAIQFFEHAGPHKIFEIPRIVGSPFMLEDTYLKKVPFPGWKIKGCLSWSQNLDNEVNRKVQAYFNESKPREMNPFTLLSWEAGQMVAEGMAGDLNADSARTRLRGFSYDSPRGRVIMDARNHTTVSSVWDAETSRSGDGNTTVHITGESPGWKEEVENWYSDVANGKGVGTSWQNLYTCI